MARLVASSGGWLGTFDAMASKCEVHVDTADREDAARVLASVADEALRIEEKFSRYRSDNVVHAINTAAGRPVTVDDETARLIDYAAQLFELSGGKFDITSGVLRRIWRFDGSDRVPSRNRIENVRRLVGWRRVRWQRPVIALESGMEIDFGGIGKEYAADRAATVLADAGVANALVNLAGDVRALGSQPTGAPWRVGIVHPRKPGGVIGAVELRDAAVATSGDYERYFEIQGRRYCHILDPRTGWPMDRWQSVSVVAPLCIVAGSLATIAMLRPDAATFLREQRYRFLLVDRDGGIVSDETPQAS